MGVEGYTNKEAREARRRKQELPNRGIVCPACKLRIPAFLGLKPEEEAQLRDLLKKRHLGDASFRLQEITGCPTFWAKIWASHYDGPVMYHPHDTKPCPYCGIPLRTNKAQQCLHCGMDWHDPTHVKRLG